MLFILYLNVLKISYLLVHLGLTAHFIWFIYPKMASMGGLGIAVIGGIWVPCSRRYGPNWEVISISSPLTTLGIQTDEFSAVNLLHSSGVISSITLDLAQICPSRSINVTFEHGSLFCDLLTNKLFVKQENNSSEHLIDSYDINESYLLQSKSFLNIDHTYENNLCSLEEAIIIQQIISDIQLNA